HGLHLPDLEAGANQRRAGGPGADGRQGPQSQDREWQGRAAAERLSAVREPQESRGTRGGVGRGQKQRQAAGSRGWREGSLSALSLARSGWFAGHERPTSSDL